MNPDRRTFLKAATALIGTVPFLDIPKAPPNLGPNVLVFDPSMPASTIQASLNSVFQQQQGNQFGGQRYALLFKPGSYAVDVNVGFYTHVAGLGRSPDDVTITGHVTVDAQWNQGNATQNFWRTAENLSVTPPDGTNRWAVAQAGPLRRVHVRGNLDLAPSGEGWSSGGFLSDALVDGQVTSGSQQQWLSRNTKWASWAGSVWNMVFVGAQNPPVQHFPNPSHTVVAQTPVVREKPFLFIDGAGNYAVFVPALRRNSQGTDWSSGGTSIPISQFFIATPANSAAQINAALAAGQHLLLTPGVYQLNQPITVTRANTVVLGLGLATLVPNNGVAAITVADVDGVSVAGLLIDAGAVNSPILVQVGAAGSTADHTANPTALFDLYARIGGAGVGRATQSLVINSNNVICDNLWLWRADHGNGIGWNTNTAATGLVVNGHDVTIYGLAVEHYQQYELVWNGNGGRTYFFQNEFPYDVPDQASWMNGSTRGFAAYKVADSVTSHQGWGLGSYSYFNAGPSIFSDRAFEVPDRSGIALTDLVTVYLAGNGGIQHVVNNIGGPSVSGSGIYYLGSFVGGGGGTPTALDRTGWIATASVTGGSDVPANMLDGKASTRWSSGTPMVPGQMITVDMGAAHTIRQITMDSGGSANDYARGYQVALSTDGTNWGAPVATGSGAGALITVPFTSTSTRYIRVTQTGSASNWWSIVEFNAYQ